MTDELDDAIIARYEWDRDHPDREEDDRAARRYEDALRGAA
jgi:hypothetical protein